MPHRLYQTLYGRILLKIFTRPSFSKMVGSFMSSEFSKPYITRFIKKNNVDMSEYKYENWDTFNDFFVRELKNGKRKINMSENVLISPCDGYLKAYTIGPDSVFTIKDVPYHISQLLDTDEYNDLYNGGICLVFRLTPSDYHRYIYPDSGAKGKNVFIQGKLHTVRPFVYGNVPVFKTNSREYTMLCTNNFDDMIFMEVGAMLVGKIVNYHQQHNFKRGEEKGRFEFGGSTIVVLLKKDVAELDGTIFDNLNEFGEAKVKLGQKIAIKK